ncbi:hypothetical protein APHAL10511_007714 [Amanita phalloides]|nr:hypothetical protein APHAL10511_007714 [Amanita phalloides]
MKSARAPVQTHTQEEGQRLLSEYNNASDRAENPMVLRFRRWKANPYWLMPVILTVNMARGVTMAPRIQVYQSIACRLLDEASSSTLPNQSLHMFMDCTSPNVAARAASIQAAVITTMSILSAVTTGFWSRLGDTYGRKPIFITFLVGAIFMEFVFILVMQPNTLFSRHAEQLLLLGPLAEGVVGAIATFNGVIHAYISDCTQHGSRSKIFSTIQGIVFIGLSIGPWLTSLILPPATSIDAFFYISMSLMFFTLTYMLFLCPESRERVAQVESPRLAVNEHSKTRQIPVIRSLTLKFLAALISPIAMFAPRHILGYTQKKSYSLTLVGLALFIYLISNGVYTSKYLFAQHLYSWTTAELGSYMSLLWIMRAINLLVVLPIIISYFKPKISSSGASLTPHEIAEELRFDRHLAQFSLALDGTSDLLVALTSANSQLVFIALSCVTSFTSGGNPALHSLGAVCLHACGYSSEVGTLFGAKAVLSAVAHIISPYIFATIYAMTVAYFPQAIFILASSLIYMSVLLLAGVRPSLKDIELVHASHTEVQPLIAPEEEDVEGAEQS